MMIDTFQIFRNNKLVQLIVVYLRFLIGGAFAFAAMVKIQGQPFTSLSTDTSIGHFFDAMHRTGFYWQFLGWAQLIAAALLMTQRFAFLGACCFFGIISNIVVITLSIDFGLGTPIITTGMFVAVLFLLFWDFPRVGRLFAVDDRVDGRFIYQDLTIANHAWWRITGLVLLGVTIVGGLNRDSVLLWLIGCTLIGAISLAAFRWQQTRVPAVR